MTILNCLLYMEYHTFVLISALVLAQAVGNGPSVKGAGRYHSRAAEGANQNSVMLFISYIQNERLLFKFKIQIRKIIYHEEDIDIFRIYIHERVYYFNQNLNSGFLRLIFISSTI